TEHVILVLSGIGYIDASSLEMLESFETALWDQRIQLHLAEIKGPVRDRLEGTELLHRLGTERVHLSSQKALDAILRGLPAVGCFSPRLGVSPSQSVAFPLPKAG